MADINPPPLPRLFSSIWSPWISLSRFSFLFALLLWFQRNIRNEGRRVGWDDGWSWVLEMPNPMGPRHEKIDGFLATYQYPLNFHICRSNLVMVRWQTVIDCISPQQFNAGLNNIILPESFLPSGSLKIVADNTSKHPKTTNHTPTNFRTTETVCCLVVENHLLPGHRALYPKSTIQAVGFLSKQLHLLLLGAIL